MIASDMIEKTEEELMAYRDMPLTRIVEDNVIKDMQEIKDWTTLNHFEACVQAMQYDAYGGAFTALRASTYATALKHSVFKGRNAVLRGLDDFVINPLIKPDLVTMRKALSDFNRTSVATGGRSRRLELDKILITKTDFEDMNNFTLQDLGDRVTGECVNVGDSVKLWVTLGVSEAVGLKLKVGLTVEVAVMVGVAVVQPALSTPKPLILAWPSTPGSSELAASPSNRSGPRPLKVCVAPNWVQGPVALKP
jgi:hypothetical protein